MKKQEILDGNKLIAEFMGYDTDNIEVTMPEYFREVKPLESVPRGYFSTTLFKFQDCKFHSSWDWLMPVVSEIEQFDNGYTKVCITDESCQISTQKNSILDPLYFEIESTSDTKIDATYKAVIEFINWYNQKK